MTARLIAATIFAVMCACAYAALVHAPAEKHPLVITSGQKEQPFRPHPQALFSPCPLTPRNVPAQKRILV